MVRVHVQQLDNKLLNICSFKVKSKFLDRIMPMITRTNDYGMIFVLLSLFSISIGYRTDMAFNILKALALGLVVGEGIIKHIFRRDRPYSSREGTQLLIKAPKTSSFPSGHTTSSFAVLFILWYSESGFKYIFLIFALMIAFSRLYLFVHYPSDVLAGIVLGLLIGFVIVIFSSSSHNYINMVAGFRYEINKFIMCYF